MLATRDELGLASRWGWVVLRGVAAVIFGLLAFTRPGTVGMGLVLLFGAYAFVGGIATVISAARNGRAGEPRWGVMLLEGLLSIAAAIAAVAWPGAVALGFIWVIALWAIATGVLEIVGAVQLRKIIQHEWALGLAGALTLALGLLMLFRPIAGGLAVVWWLGAYALVFGALMIVVGFRLRSLAHTQRGGGDVRMEGLHQRA